MSKRRLKKASKKSDMVPRLRKALAKRRKDELIDVLVEWAKEDRRLLRRDRCNRRVLCRVVF
jgi:hypothetical protein